MTFSPDAALVTRPSAAFFLSRIQSRTWFVMGLAAIVLLAAVLRLTHVPPRRRRNCASG